MLKKTSKSNSYSGVEAAENYSPLYKFKSFEFFGHLHYNWGLYLMSLEISDWIVECINDLRSNVWLKILS